jgi:hypothetical protein
MRAEDVVDDRDMFAETTQKLGEAAVSALIAMSLSEIDSKTIHVEGLFDTEQHSEVMQ